MFKDKLKSLRKEHNLTQVELADKLFVSRSLIARWEYGDVFPTLDNIGKIASFFNIPINDLLCDEEKTGVIVHQASLEEKRKRIVKIILSLINIIISIIVLFIFFPSLQIWGFTHEVITDNDLNLTITITEQTLFKVLNDSFYDNKLKTIYIIIFSLEIISNLFSLIAFIQAFKRKNRFDLITILISCSFNVMLCCSILLAFIYSFPLNIISCFFLFLSSILTILSTILITKRKNGII